MDDEDAKWLTGFNSKAEGTSGDVALSPLRESHGPIQMQPPSAGRPSRNKGKDREKDTPAPVFISEDTFEYVMGVLEKHAEDSVPMLHTVGPALLHRVSTNLTCPCRTYPYSLHLHQLNPSFRRPYLHRSYPAMKFQRVYRRPRRWRGWRGISSPIGRIAGRSGKVERSCPASTCVLFSRLRHALKSRSTTRRTMETLMSAFGGVILELLGKHGGPTTFPSSGCRRYRRNCDLRTISPRWFHGVSRRRRRCIRPRRTYGKPSGSCSRRSEDGQAWG